jgi:DNA topoisomerase-3
VSQVRELLSGQIQTPRTGKDAGDHPPITPTRAAGGELSGDAWRLYELVARHFVASLSSDCVYLQTTISVDIGTEQFTCTGQRVIDPGFTVVLPWLSPNEEESVPDVSTGDMLKVDQLMVVERKTSPPSYLSESELITLMEKHGIGTDASIPVHINNICERNYVTIGNGRQLVPTSLGIVLIHGYQKIDPELALPTMRGAIEKQLDLIALGKVACC